MKAELRVGFYLYDILQGGFLIDGVSRVVSFSFFYSGKDYSGNSERWGIFGFGIVVGFPYYFYHLHITPCHSMIMTFYLSTSFVMAVLVNVLTTMHRYDSYIHCTSSLIQNCQDRYLVVNLFSFLVVIIQICSLIPSHPIPVIPSI